MKSESGFQVKKLDTLPIKLRDPLHLPHFRASNVGLILPKLKVGEVFAITVLNNTNLGDTTLSTAKIQLNIAVVKLES